VGGSFDGTGIFVADGQRLFHHYRNMVLGTNVYRATMVECVGVDEDGMRVRGGERFIEIGVPQVSVEAELCGVAIEQFAVGLRDGDDLNVLAIFDAREESVSVTVREPCHRNT
jgi:hypothetical protein